MTQKLKLISMTILFIILSLFVAIGMIVGMETILHAKEIKKCDSSYTLNYDNIGKEFIKRLEIAPLSQWYRKLGSEMEIYTKMKGKEITLRWDGSLSIEFTTMRFGNKLQKRLEKLYKNIECEVEAPEINIMLDLLR